MTKNSTLLRSLCAGALSGIMLLGMTSCGSNANSNPSSAPSAGGGIPVLEKLEVSVADGAVIYSRQSPDMIDFTAIATFSDGSTQDVTANCIPSADMSQTGDSILSVRYSRNGVAKTAEAPIVVQESVFVSDAVPNQYQDAECPEKGTLEHIDYSTFTYGTDGAAGEAGTNEAFIYLPYGYDPETSYNILYLMHGGGENANYWFGQGMYAAGGEKDSTDENFTVAMLDNLIYQGYCEPLIVVTPCIKTDNKYGCNGVDTFRYEFKNDLVPAVESVYATYANGDTSPESLIASRDHRAYDGLSMGSMTSFSSILMGCTDYVSYVGSFSGSKVDVDALVASLNGPFASYHLNYWYNGNGTNDMAHDEHLDVYGKIMAACAEHFTEGEDFQNGANCIFVDKPNKVHSYASWVVDLYNTLAVFFK